LVEFGKLVNEDAVLSDDVQQGVEVSWSRTIDVQAAIDAHREPLNPPAWVWSSTLGCWSPQAD